MKRGIITFLFFFIAVTGYSQEPNCKRFKTGKFYYPDLPGKISLRKDSIQESYNNGNLEMIWKLRWLNDCEYELTCEKMFVDFNSYKTGDRIKATIIKTAENCFTTEIIFYNKENPQGLVGKTGEMCFVKE